MTMMRTQAYRNNVSCLEIPNNDRIGANTEAMIGFSLGFSQANCSSAVAICWLSRAQEKKWLA